MPMLIYLSQGTMNESSQKTFCLIFTGKTPYPGLDPGASFYDKLLNGYRMDNPGKCPMIIYRAMSECWAAEPGHRPTFKKLMDLGRYSVPESVKCCQPETGYSE